MRGELHLIWLMRRNHLTNQKTKTNTSWTSHQNDIYRLDAGLDRCNKCWYAVIWWQLQIGHLWFRQIWQTHYHIQKTMTKTSWTFHQNDISRLDAGLDRYDTCWYVIYGEMRSKHSWFGEVTFETFYLTEVMRRHHLNNQKKTKDNENTSWTSHQHLQIGRWFGQVQVQSSKFVPSNRLHRLSQHFTTIQPPLIEMFL